MEKIEIKSFLPHVKYLIPSELSVKQKHLILNIKH
jgi:hypothetical protein